MMPIVNGLEAEFEGAVAVHRLEMSADANSRLQAAYGLRGHPTFAVLDSRGEVVDRFVGLQTAEALREAMAQVR
jgi:thioredoxin-like negative regulator of GroEL